jgi:hypothetical protein
MFKVCGPGRPEHNIKLGDEDVPGSQGRLSLFASVFYDSARPMILPSFSVIILRIKKPALCSAG